MLGVKTYMIYNGWRCGMNLSTMNSRQFAYIYIYIYILYNHDNYNTKTRIYDMLSCDIYYHRKCTTETHNVSRLPLPHCETVASYSVADLGHHWWRQWLGACSAPSHYLNQCCLLSIGQIEINISENWIQRQIFIQENASPGVALSGLVLCCTKDVKPILAKRPRVAKMSSLLSLVTSRVVITNILCIESWDCFQSMIWDKTSHIDGFVEDCSNSSALALELQQSWTKPSIWNWS